MTNVPAKTLLVSVCLAAWLMPGLARAQATEVLTNESVVQMVVGKVPKNLILTKVRTTSNTFDNTPKALVNLFKNKVTTDVITAMIDASARPDSKEVLTNDQVIFMVTSDLPKALILKKIRETKAKFDLTTAGLVSLSQNKVSNEIQTAMMNAAGSGGSAPSGPPNPPPAASTPAAKAAPAANGTSAKGSVADGEAVVLYTTLSTTAALNKVKAYFSGKKIDVTVNAETNRIVSVWYNERSCGLQKCANRANVRVASAGGRTAVTIQVFERKRDAGASTKPWNENATSKGKETAELAAALEPTLK